MHAQSIWTMQLSMQLHTPHPVLASICSRSPHARSTYVQATARTDLSGSLAPPPPSTPVTPTRKRTARSSDLSAHTDTPRSRSHRVHHPTRAAHVPIPVPRHFHRHDIQHITSIAMVWHANAARPRGFNTTPTPLTTSIHTYRSPHSSFAPPCGRCRHMKRPCIRLYLPLTLAWAFSASSRMVTRLLKPLVEASFFGKLPEQRSTNRQHDM